MHSESDPHVNLKTPSRTNGNETEHVPFARRAKGSKGKNYFNGGRWLDAKALCHWLDGQIPAEYPRHSSLVRRMYNWRHEDVVADIYVVERYLCLLDIHPMDIPDECWTDKAPDRGKWARKREKPPKPEERAQAVADWHKGGGDTEGIAQQYRVTPRTINNWVRADTGGDGVNPNEKSLDPSAVASGVEEAA